MSIIAKALIVSKDGSTAEITANTVTLGTSMDAIKKKLINEIDWLFSEWDSVKIEFSRISESSEEQNNE